MTTKIILNRCIDLNCLRNDHIICPIGFCHEICHPTIVDENMIMSLKRCPYMSCLSHKHVMCPTCGYTLHQNIKLIIL